MSLDSPFAHRLRQNYIAQPDEEAGIKKAIEKQHAIIRKLDLELEDIDKAMAALTAKRKVLLGRRKTHQTFADDHQSLVSGILHLPVDILSEIFMDLVPEDGDCTIPHPIVRLSHVCRQWRDIALSNPMLWTTLNINELSPPKNASEEALQDFERRMLRLADIFPVLISRAAESPMTLNVIGEEDPAFPSAMLAYARLVFPITNLLREVRWEKIRLNLVPRHPDSPLLQLLQTTAQSCGTLREAEIHLKLDSTSMGQDVIGRLDLGSMERLSVLHLGLRQISPLEVQIHWKSLTELHLYAPMQAHGVLKLLIQCPNLIRLTTGLFDSPPSSQSPYPSHSVPLLCLDTLRIVGETKELAHSLVLPRLGTLQIMDSLNSPSDIAVPQWLRDYGAQLTHIAFCYDYLTFPTLLRCLEDISAVISLEIGPSPLAPHLRPVDKELSNLHRSVLDALTAKQGGPGASICPCVKLEKIIIRAPDRKTDIGDWVEFLASRRVGVQGSVAFLKSAEICFPDQGSSERTAAASTHVKVCDELARRGISTHGIKFAVKKGVQMSR